jgi:hypothetical protein
MKLNAMVQWGQVLFFAFTHMKSAPVDIFLYEGRLTALEHKCIKYIFVGSGFDFCFCSDGRTLEGVSVS